jgi:hypothetical protein
MKQLIHYKVFTISYVMTNYSFILTVLDNSIDSYIHTDSVVFNKNIYSLGQQRLQTPEYC